jgi:hypothetical protein
MHLPEGKPGQEDHDRSLAEFNTKKKNEYQKIEEFMQILNDWVEETVPEIEAALAIA